MSVDPTLTIVASTPLVIFFCILNEPDCPFSICIQPTEAVNALRNAILKKNPKTFANIESDQLKLWKLDASELIALQNTIAARIRSWGSDLSKFAEMMDVGMPVSEFFAEMPPVGYIHVIVQSTQHELPTYEPALKRPRLESYQPYDTSKTFCDVLIKPFDTIPKLAQDIGPLINAELLGKLPVRRSWFEKCTLRAYISDIIQPQSNDDSDLTFHITNALRENNTGVKVENGKSTAWLHSIVDSLIRYPLETLSLFSKVQLVMDRSSTDWDIETEPRCNPHCLGWVNGTLLFWGEETSPSPSDSHPSGSVVTDMEEKFRHVDDTYFGDIKFMICFSVDGPLMRFYVADGSVKKKRKRIRPLTDNLDMNFMLHRVEIVKIVVNIVRILLTIKNSLPQEAVYPLGAVKYCERTMIMFNFDGVLKVVPVTDLPFSGDLQHRVQFLQDMYNHAIGHRGLVQVNHPPHTNESESSYIVSLSTKGIPLAQRPRNEEELRKMGRDIITGLARLHDGDFLHRDIRSANIVYDPRPQRCEYVLIDFEHGCKAGTEKWPGGLSALLRDWDGETLVGGVYKKESDIYQLGKVLREMSVGLLSEQGRDFLELLGRKKLSAKGALRHVWLK